MSQTATTDSNPICLCGFTQDGKPVLGGAFQMADTLGFPLVCSMDAAEKRKCVVSIPHYFASAMEHGWDDEQTFARIKEALVDRNEAGHMERIRKGCIFMFMQVAKTMPGESAKAIGRKMRENLEADALAHKVIAQALKRE